jgi:DNA end-binding protein Ku
MPRSIWNGSIAFGLVNIPVRLFPATEQRDPRFHLVDRGTRRRVRYRRVVEEPATIPDDLIGVRPAEEPRDSGSDEAAAAADTEQPAREEPPTVTLLPERREREVSYEEIARGYDVGGGQHVVVEREELEALRPEGTRTIEVEHFVPLAEVDPVYFEKSYFVAPANDLAEKPYALLRLAMERTERVAVGRFVLRTREHLALIRPTLGVLGLETLYFADEVRRPADHWIQTVEPRDPTVPEAEVRMAERLIEALATEWQPEQYRDPYRESVLDLLRSRAPAALPESYEEAPAASVTDLMEALRASVEAIKSTSRSRRGRRAEG